jgi:hypothetical protein
MECRDPAASGAAILHLLTRGKSDIEFKLTLLKMTAVLSGGSVREAYEQGCRRPYEAGWTLSSSFPGLFSGGHTPSVIFFFLACNETSAPRA